MSFVFYLSLLGESSVMITSFSDNKLEKLRRNIKGVYIRKIREHVLL
jgi:hypothetical protein